MKSTKEIKEIIKSILEGSELFLVDVSISADNSLEVYIDSLTGVERFAKNWMPNSTGRPKISP